MHEQSSESPSLLPPQLDERAPSVAALRLLEKLVDEARAAWLRHYAAQNGFDLENSYGYGDNHADLVWLQLVGNPNAVNPDINLYRHAKEKHWNVLDWKRKAASAVITDSEVPAIEGASRGI